MADPTSKANPGFPGRQNQPFPSPTNCVMGNPQLGSVNSSNMMQNPMQIPNMLQNPVMPAPNMPQPITRPIFSGAASNFFPFQNNQLVPPQMGLVGPTSQLGQFNMGFNHGNSVNNVNTAALLALLGQLMQNSAQVNLSQSQGQLFNPGFMNGPQQQLQQQLQHNMNMNRPSGQFLDPGIMQNLNQIVSLQGINPSQVAPSAFLQCSQPFLGIPNQVSQGIMPQGANFNTNPPFGGGQYNQSGQLLNQSSGNFVRCALGENGLSPRILSSQLQGNVADPRGSGLVQNMRPSAITNSEGNPVHNSMTGNSQSNWEDSPCKNFMKKPVGGEFQRGYKKFIKEPNGGQFEGRFQKFNSHNMNVRRKLGFPDKHNGKGSKMKSSKKFHCDATTPENKGVKRYLHIYSEEEIKQWRESRRKNYPSKQNLEKKQRAKLDHSELTSRETQLKNELAEVLSKQAKLGVEVAELPAEYLLDSAQQGQRSKEDTKMTSYKDRNQNKSNKRQGYNKKDRFSKKQKLGNDIISNDNTPGPLSEIHPEQTRAAVPSNYTPHAGNQDPANDGRVNNRFKRGRHPKKGGFDKKQKLANRNQRGNIHAPKREPTLLQKLLGADISRDKSRLLHVFRFMVVNSFFKDWRDKPLTYPSVMVDGVKHQCAAEDRVSLADGASEQVGNKIAAKDFASSSRNISSDEDDGEDGNDEDNLVEHCTQDPDTMYAIGKEFNNGESEEPDQEEGEILA